MSLRGDKLTLGLLAAVAAAAAWRGQRGGRNAVSPQQEREIYQLLFPQMRDLSEIQLKAMERGEILFHWGDKPETIAVYTLDQLPVRRSVKSKPIMEPTIRGPKFKHHRLRLGPIRGDDYIEPGVGGGVLALDDGASYEEYYLPSDLVELEQGWSP